MELTKAYVMIKTVAGEEKDVFPIRDEVANIGGVVLAEAVLGDSDIIAEVSVENEEDLHEKVLNLVRKMPGIKSTNTLIVVEQ